MSARIPQPTSLGRLDVLLAQRILDGGGDGQELLDERQARDRCWIIGALGCRGVHVTAADVDAAIQGTAGRFLPGQPEFELLRGLHRAIDEVDTRAHYGQCPSGESAIELYSMFTIGLDGLVEASLRDTEPWEVLPGIDYPEPGEIAGRLARFDDRTAFGTERDDWKRLHPITRAALLLGGFVSVSPFRDFNLLTGSLLASWYLLAHGYPPFLPQANDRPTMKVVLGGPERQLVDWFAEVVLVGYRSIGEVA